MTVRKKRAVLLLALAGSLALILWITLFSRFGSDIRVIYAPFWSYRKIANGEYHLLLEDFENVLLFLPLGLLAAWVLRLRLPAAVLLGALCSLFIECSQWLFWLGSFEADDLLHNTLGTLLGFVFAVKTGIGQRLLQVCRKKDLPVIAVLVAAFLCVPLCGQWLHTQSMKRFAALNDLKDGAANLLVPDGKNGYVEETQVRVDYCDDGSIRINGAAENRSWFSLGKVTLPKGTYRFSGFDETPETAFDLELEALDRESCKFIRLVCVDSKQDAIFTLEKETRLRVLVGVFPGANGTALCRPAIYRGD
ncbi:MAG: VanZ family protein [Clostridia bacterium]|nr:VanZ family protein [Clostridia bacterium]